MKRILSLFLVFIICFCFVGCGSDKFVNENAYSPLLYKVSDEDSTIWLFGSVHVATKDMYPLPDYIKSAFDNSDILAVEADIIALEQNASVLGEQMAKFIYKDGTTISDNVSKETYEKAKKILEKEESYNAFVDFYNASMWANTINNFLYTNLGYDSNLGLDSHFLQSAKDSGKTIYEIESVEAQYDMLSGFSKELQAFMLEDAVKTYNDKKAKEAIEKLIKSWYNGDEQGIIESNTADTSECTEEEKALLEEYNNAILTKRNIAMTDYAEKALQTDKDVFICVGAAHIVGDGAIVDLLCERGYEVTKVK